MFSRSLEAVAANCSDSDNGATDIYGDGCSWYWEAPEYCGDHDDDDFEANTMCCRCKIGLNISLKYKYTAFSS